MTGNSAGGASVVASEAPLLDPDEPPAFELVNPHGRAGLLLVCDHASNRIPRRLAGLGLTPEHLGEHIAWDPGAAAVARGLAERLDAPLILGGYSRLVVDLNRPLESPELIPECSDGVAIPGNQNLDQEAREQRLTALFWPYHQAIAAWLDAHAEPVPCLIALHSFTPQLGGERRPWHIGIAYGRDSRLAKRLLRAFAVHEDLIVGDNCPYAIEDSHDYTLTRHGECRGLPHAMIEIRQDGVETPEQIEGWVSRLASLYASVGTLEERH